MKDIVFSGHQPNFLPYMGFFYKVFKSDVFVLDDDVQYSNEEYHNMNFIKVQREKFRVTVPVSYEFGDKINEVKICYNKPWVRKFLETLKMNYRKAPHFDEVYEMIETTINKKYEYLVDLNIDLLTQIIDRFGFDTRIIIASKDVPTELVNNERNIYQCKKVGANVYYSGIGGKNYNDEEAYNKEGIRIEYSDYKPVKYKQTGWNYIENLSVLDYIFNEGFVIPKEWEE